MLSGIALALLTGIIWTLVAVIYSRSVTDEKKFLSFMAFYSLFFMASAWGCPLPHAAPAHELLQLAAVMVPASVLGVFAFYALSLAMRQGSHGVAWGIMQSAIVWPFLVGLFFLHNPATVCGLTGLFLILGALGLIVKGKISAQQKTQTGSSRKFLFWIALSFASVGLGQALTLIPNGLMLSEQTLTWRIPLFTSGNLVWIVLAAFGRERLGWEQWKTGLLYAVVVLLGQKTLYWAIDRLEAYHASAVVYPLAIGSSIFFFMLYCIRIKKEQVSNWELVGMAALAGGIVLCSL